MSLQLDNSDTGESFGPFNSYYLAFGLTLDFNGIQGIVTGGNSSSVNFASDTLLLDYGLLPSYSYTELVDRIHRDVGAQLLGIKRDSGNEMAFRIGDRMISHKWLSEELLARLLRLESKVKLKVIQTLSIDTSDLHECEESCAQFRHFVQTGRLGPDILKDVETLGTPMKEAFFLHNAQEIAEDTRSMIGASCYNFANLVAKSAELNQYISNCTPLARPPVQGHEITFSSEQVDELSTLYTNSIINCYSALEMLYEFFKYLMREPFGNPNFPKGLYFSDVDSKQSLQDYKAADGNDSPDNPLARAIPNLPVGHFAALRRTRNDLVHNMAADGMRPFTYVGAALPIVKNMPLQYVQYITRDLDGSGTPVSTNWCRRFYTNRTDAHCILYEWIEQTWQCIFDTIDWLTDRLTHDPTSQL